MVIRTFTVTGVVTAPKVTMVLSVGMETVLWVEAVITLRGITVNNGGGSWCNDQKRKSRRADFE